ncbi:MAG TPA: glycosyltransferase family 4 protein [Chitinophagales bacterium]|nr:glycosyltransferase family 4 protein [Chitinophagales bacterium]
MSEKNRKILHISSADIWRGAEQQIIYLYKGLQEAGNQQMIFCIKDGLLAKYCSENQITYQTYQRNTGINFQLALLIKKYTRENTVDIIHIHDPHAHHAYLTAYILGLKVPAILHRRVDFPTAQNGFSAWKYQCKGIKKIICVSKEVQRVLNVNSSIGKKLEVIYDGVDIEKYQKINGRKILEQEYSILRGKIIIANIAALVDHKDIPTYIKAVHYLVKVLEVKNLHFLIIGDGAMKNELQQMIANYHLGNVITMTGNRIDIPQILNGIDIYTFTSKLEGFGSTILEVMSARVPIIATNIGGPREILTHKKNALLIPVGDYIGLAHQIDTLIHHPEIAQQLKENSFQKVQQFSVKNYTEQIENIYHQIL